MVILYNNFLQKYILAYIYLLIFTCFAAYAEDIITGSYCYTYGDYETKVDARKKTRLLAIKNAIESYQIYIYSTSKVKNGILKEQIINTISSSYLKNIKILDKNETISSICYSVQANISAKDVKKLIESQVSSINNHNAKNKEPYEEILSKKQSSSFIISKLYSSLIGHIHSVILSEKKYKNVYEVVSFVWQYLVNDISPYNNCYYTPVDKAKLYYDKVNKVHAFLVSIDDKNIKNLVNYIYNNIWLPNKFIKKKIEIIIEQIERSPDMGSQLNNYCGVMFNIERNRNGRILLHPLVLNSSSCDPCVYYVKKSAEQASSIQKFFFRQGPIFKKKFLLAAKLYIQLASKQAYPIVESRKMDGTERLKIIPLTENIVIREGEREGFLGDGEKITNDEFLTKRITEQNYQAFIDYTNWTFDNNFFNKLAVVNYNNTNYISDLHSLSKIAYIEWLNSLDNTFSYRMLGYFENSTVKKRIKIDPVDSLFLRLAKQRVDIGENLD